MSEDLRDFERLVAALQPWRDELVIVGGWAHRLHHEHPLAIRPGFSPLRTRDADLAFAARAKLAGNVAQALKAAGFHAELSSNEEPPIAQYFLGNENQGFYAEFLTPLTGSGTRRDGTTDATLARSGITAQKLRHLDVLLVAPWTTQVGGTASSTLSEPVQVLVANPAAFIAQKLLIHTSRTARKQAQDVLYIHDTLQLFGAHWDELASTWREFVLPSLTQQQIIAITELRLRIFEKTTDVIRSAARIPIDRILRPEDVRIICERGLAAVLAAD